ncbi:hypothetical protein PHLCEN_2v6219 [Hermanssonia centrifuga]|uniref:MIP18 family-like domain-containing protein n=1 Tax=Hermanssonia centrifuga TaxID=98765 RepID=A0A2R6P036_9APHY|nr:hypothetical protein PHLCEN_2v6219 [Hermanssonia centrifuga]
MESFNPNPTIFVTSKHRATHFAKPHSLWLDEEGSDNDLETEDESNDIEEIDQDEIFDLIRSISDPEHRNMSLEQLAVVSAPQITFDRKVPERLTVEFTPTVPHCGMSTFIVNKQLNDKERVAAALENPALLEVLEQCLSTAGHGNSEET